MLPLKHVHRKKLHSVKKYKNTLLDHLIYLFAFAGPVMTLPQVYDIWVTKTVSVNTLTWTSYLVIGVVWLYYGMVHKEKPIIYSNLLGVIINALVVSGSILVN